MWNVWQEILGQVSSLTLSAPLEGSHPNLCESQCGPTRFKSGSCLLEPGGVVWLQSDVKEVEDVRKRWGADVLHLIGSEAGGNDVDRGCGSCTLGGGSTHSISALNCFCASAWQFNGPLDLPDDLLWFRANVENPLFSLVQDFLRLFADPRLIVGEYGWMILTILDKVMLSTQHDETESTSSSVSLEEERSLFHSVDSKWIRSG